jgi:cytochrome c oxidase subunit 2
MLFNLLTLNYTPLLLDAPKPWGIYFQDSASPSFEGIVELHDQILFYLIVVIIGVSWVLASVLRNFNSNSVVLSTNNENYRSTKIVHKYANHGTLIELIWTITPALVLVAIAFPSFKLLYLMDEVLDPAMTIKAIGHQWYWSYEYADFLDSENNSIEFDSYMIPDSDLEPGQLRLLETDNKVVIPVDTHVRFVISGADVIHDFAVPSLGLKVDAIPGRLNQSSVLALREGTFYGQCSEICGVLHSSMPIQIEAVNLEKFISWLDSSF